MRLWVVLLAVSYCHNPHLTTHLPHSRPPYPSTLPIHPSNRPTYRTPQSLHICCNLSNLYRNVDRLEEARSYYSRALQGYVKAYGANHAETKAVRKELEEIHHHGQMVTDSSTVSMSVSQSLVGSGKRSGSRKGSVFAIAMRKDVV